jgi:hypothetical protein
VLARPPLLTNGPETHHTTRTADASKRPRNLWRADLADLLVESTTSNEWVGKAVHTGGSCQ